jgi:soluble lytic murein transglycosylase-like protein
MAARTRKNESRPWSLWRALLWVVVLWLGGTVLLAAYSAWQSRSSAPGPLPWSTPRATPSPQAINCQKAAPPTDSHWLAVAHDDAVQYHIDPLTFAWKIWQESGFNPQVHKSSAGAIGIAQFMPDTAAGMGIDPHDPKQALDASARLDAGHLKQYAADAQQLAAHFGGNQARYAYGLALSAYNAGPGATTRAWEQAYGNALAGRRSLDLAGAAGAGNAARCARHPGLCAVSTCSDYPGRPGL